MTYLKLSPEKAAALTGLGREYVTRWHGNSNHDEVVEQETKLVSWFRTNVWPTATKVSIDLDQGFDEDTNDLCHTIWFHVDGFSGEERFAFNVL